MPPVPQSSPLSPPAHTSRIRRPSFVEDATDALTALRAGLKKVFAGLSTDLTRPTDLQNLLEIDAPLAWGVHKTATTPETCAAGLYVPSPARIKAFLQAAQRACVDTTVLDEVQTAMDRFEDVVQRHAGDRDTFNSMIADLAGEDSTAQDRKHKRAAYRANGHLWGFQAKATLSLIILRVVADPLTGKNTWDSVNVRGFVQLRQVRKDAALRADMYWQRPIGAQNMSITPLRLPSRQTTMGPAIEGLLLPYCSDPFPRLTTTRDSGGLFHTEIALEDLGDAAASTFFYGYHTKRWSSEESSASLADFRSIVSTPVELFIRDVFIHQQYWDGSEPSLSVLRPAPPDLDLLHERASLKLPVQERITSLGKGLGTAGCEDVPAYDQLLADVFASVGWNPTEFWGYRAHVEYPVLSSVLRMNFGREHMLTH